MFKTLIMPLWSEKLLFEKQIMILREWICRNKIIFYKRGASHREEEFSCYSYRQSGREGPLEVTCWFSISVGVYFMYLCHVWCLCYVIFSLACSLALVGQNTIRDGYNTVYKLLTLLRLLTLLTLRKLSTWFTLGDLRGLRETRGARGTRDEADEGAEGAEQDLGDAFMGLLSKMSEWMAYGWVMDGHLLRLQDHLLC